MEPQRRSVFITGANGYIGTAVSRAFVRAGWRVYGLIRRSEAAAQLLADEVTPIIGSIDDDSPQSLDSILAALDRERRAHGPLDVVVGCTEALGDHRAHHGRALRLVRAVVEGQSDQGKRRPLVLYTSGCKDYGTTPLHGAPDLTPHTETSPLHCPDFIRGRTEAALAVFDEENAGSGLFDAVVLRPTNVYGYSSSYYGIVFEFAKAAAAAAVKKQGERKGENGEGEGEREEGFEVAIDPNSIMHALHVDDCADAYVSLALRHLNHSSTSTSPIAGQVFNIASAHYSTAGAILSALAAEYAIPGGFIPNPSSEQAKRNMAEGVGGAAVSLFGWSQWVGSEKLRAATGWTERRMGFVEGVGVYRRAWEEAGRRPAGEGDVARVRGRTGFFAGVRGEFEGEG